MIRFAERWAGEGFVCVLERSVTMVEYTISMCVDGDMLKVFWSYCLELLYSSLSAWSVLAWGGI